MKKIRNFSVFQSVEIFQLYVYNFSKKILFFKYISALKLQTCFFACFKLFSFSGTKHPVFYSIAKYYEFQCSSQHLFSYFSQFVSDRRTFCNFFSNCGQFADKSLFLIFLHVTKKASKTGLGTR